MNVFYISYFLKRQSCNSIFSSYIFKLKNYRICQKSVNLYSYDHNSQKEASIRLSTNRNHLISYLKRRQRQRFRSGYIIWKNDPNRTKLTSLNRENIWTVPNFMSLSRMILAPCLGQMIIDCQMHQATCLLIVAGLLDVMDGIIARNIPGQESKLGSFLDPMADKILIITLFLTLTYVGLIPVILTVLIASRDICLATAGFVIRYKSLPPPKTVARFLDAEHATAQLAPTTLSKINTFLQLTTGAIAIISPVLGIADHPALFYLWSLTGTTTILSALGYAFSSDTYTFLKKKPGS